MTPPIIVVNFAHPFTTAQRDEIEQLCGGPIQQVIDVITQLDHGEPFAPQIARLVDAAGLSTVQWQTEPLIVNLPTFSPAVAVILAHLHGLIGHFPTVVRLRPRDNGVPISYEVAEIIDLQRVRDYARGER